MNQMTNSPYKYFIWPLVIGNILLISFYFSGNYALQQIVAPTFPYFDQQSREFGVLEMLQNAFLLFIIALFCKAVFQARPRLDKVFFAIGCATFIVLFLEEIDYGLHFRTLLSETPVQFEFRNIHNQWTDDGVEYATYMKKISDGITILWFALVPFILFLSPYSERAKQISLLPTRWFFFGFVIALLFSNLAHYLDDNGYGVINNSDGMLAASIAEFRETSIYYLYCLYALQLYMGSPLFKLNGFNSIISIENSKTN